MSNAPIFGLSIYRLSLELFNKAGLSNLVNKRNQLTIYLEEAINSFNHISNGLKFKIITPGSPEKRGSQLSLLVNQNNKEIYNFLRKEGVFIDLKNPNIIRIAPVPLYNSFEDIARFYQILIKCI